LEKLQQKQQDCSIWILSGGYDIYIKYFVHEFKLDGLVSSQIKFSNTHKCLGKLSGIDCLSENKIVLFAKQVDLGSIDLKNSYAYSDSETDLPMLKLVGNGIVISKYFSQEWAAKNTLKEIVWN